ncbi:MAG: hypothetical protein IT158_23330 [Bryobacterales bacterium]|nr:hypothetical protein [Bryobacterales bacterium]
MCDYSLHSVPNRLAREGEDLVVHRFSTGSIGLAPPEEVRRAREPQVRPRGFWAAVKSFFNPDGDHPVPAVCIPPGARLMLQDIPESLRNNLGVSAQEEVTFTEITAAAFTYRDAVRFANGKEVRLQALREGQRVRVLSLASEDGVQLDMEFELNRRRARLEQLV